MNKAGIFLVLLSLALIMFPVMHADVEKTLTFIIHGPAQVYLVYPNGTEIPVGNGTYYFTSIMGVYVQAPQGYDLYVNGTKIPLYYLRFFNSSTTLVIYAIPVYNLLTINLEGNGSVVLHFQNGTEVELTTSASFKVLNTTFVYITSTTPFMVDRNTMVTHYFGENITSNTTWNVIFNPPLPKGYLNITVIVMGQGTVYMKVYNFTPFPRIFTVLAEVPINHTESFLVPKGYLIAFYSYNDFTVNDKPAFYLFNQDYYWYYYGEAKYNSTIIIVLQKATTTTTITTTTTSHPVQTSTTTVATTTVTQSNQQHSNNNSFVAVMAIGVAMLVSAIYLAVKVLGRKD